MDYMEERDLEKYQNPAKTAAGLFGRPRSCGALYPSSLRAQEP